MADLYKKYVKNSDSKPNLYNKYVKNESNIQEELKNRILNWNNRSNTYINQARVRYTGATGTMDSSDPKGMLRNYKLDMNSWEADKAPKTSSSYTGPQFSASGKYEGGFKQDASEWYTKMHAEKSFLDTEAQAINDFIRDNDKYISGDVKTAWNKLYSASQNGQNSALSTAKLESNLFGDYETEEDFIKGYEEFLYDDKVKTAHLQKEENVLTVMNLDLDDYNRLRKKRDEARIKKDDAVYLRERFKKENYPDIMISGKTQEEINDIKRQIKEQREQREADFKPYDDAVAKAEAEIADIQRQIEEFEKTRLHVYGGSYDGLLEAIKSQDGLVKDIKNYQDLYELEHIYELEDYQKYSDIGKGMTDYSLSLWNEDELEGYSTTAARDFEDIYIYIREKGMPLQDEINDWLPFAPGITDHAQDIEDIALGMTQKEYDAYAYYAGKGDEEKKKLIIDTVRNRLIMEEAQEKYEFWGGDDASTLAQVANRFSSEFGSFFDNVKYNFTSYYPMESEARDVATAQVHSDLEDKDHGMLSSVVGGIGNQLPSIVASMIVTAATGNPTVGSLVGNVSMGVSASGSAYRQAIEMGYDEWDARSYGALVGGSELAIGSLLSGVASMGGSLTSKGISALTDSIDDVILKAGTSKIGRIAAQTAKIAVQHGGRMVSEFGEEYLQAVLEPWYQNILLGTDNSINPFSKEVLEAGLVGALSAGVINASQSVATLGVNTGTKAINNYQTGKQLKADGIDVNQIADIGKTFSADTVAYKIANKVDESTGAYTIGKLFNEVNATMSEQNKSEIIDTLVNKGVLRADAEILVDSIETSMALGEDNFSVNERYILDNNPALNEAVREVLVDKNTTLYQRISGAVEINKQLTEKALQKVANKFAKGESVSDEEIDSFAEETDLSVDTMEAESITASVDEASTDSTPNRVMTESKTYNTVDNTEAAVSPVEKIVSTKDGKVKYQTKDGETVDASEAVFRNEDEAVIYETALDMGLPAAVINYAVKEYDSNTASALEYIYGVRTAYEYGASGIHQSYISSDALSALSHKQRQDAYELGKAIAQDEVATRQKAIGDKVSKSKNAKMRKGTVQMDGKEYNVDTDETLTEVQKESVNASKFLATVLGNDINLYNSYVATEGKYEGRRVYKKANGEVALAPNGFYNPDGSINIDINAGSIGEGIILETLGHELTHHIRAWSPAKFKVMADFLFDQYYKHGVDVQSLIHEQIAKAKRNGRTISYDVAYEEVVADAFSRMLTDTDAISKLAKTDKGLYNKVKAWIKGIVNKINKLYSRYDPQSKEAQYVKKMNDVASELQRLWLEGLEDASKAYKTSIETAENEVHSSFRNEEVIELAVDSELAEKLEKNKKSKYTIIKDYLVEKFYGQKFKLSDGIEAIMDKSDAQELSHKADMKKTAALSNLRDIIEKAQFLAKADKVNHKKFDAFRYYSIKVSFEGKIYDILLNVGHLKYQDEYHIYDITKKGETANQSSTGLSQPVGNAIKNSFSNRSLPQQSENSQQKFSLRGDVEETKDLIAVHNLSEEKLLKTLELGGFPMPSIAVFKSKEGHTDFGDISVVFGKETIDPQLLRSNKVFSGDAYTPTYPHIDYKINKTVVEKGVDDVERLIKSKGFGKDDFGYLSSISEDHFKYGNTDEVANKTALKVAYLIDKGIDFKPVYKEEELSDFGRFDNFVVKHIAEALGKERIVELHNNSEGVKAAVEEIRNLANKYKANKYQDNAELFDKLSRNPFYGENNFGFSQAHEIVEGAYKYFNNGSRRKINEMETKKVIAGLINQTDYKKWVDNLFEGFIEKEGIRNNKDIFTSSGNRRSFEALHYEHNLENVVKAMKEEGIKGIGGFGGGNIFGASTIEYNSISDIKNSAQNRLQNLSDEEFAEIKKGFADRFYELASSLPNNKESFSATDDAANVLVEAISKYKTKSGIANYIRRECQGWATYSDYIVDDLLELVSDIRQMPTKYFEAKPQRAVGFDEVKAIIIPDNSSSKLKSALKSKSFDVLEYQSGNEQERIDALNSLDEIKFSSRDSAGNTLSKEQQEFFKDSKVRDEKGNLLVVYHGTQKADFTVFKRNFNFYTDNKEMADSYANNSEMYTGYLNIANPYIIDAKGEKWSKISIDNETKDMLDRYGSSTFKEGGKWRTTPADIAYAILDGIDEGEFDYDGIIIKNVNDTGSYYKSNDNIIADDYITFNSNQFKNVDNKAPTSDADIRYSDRKLEKITANMSDDERYEILKNRKINNVPHTKNIPADIVGKLPQISSWDDINKYMGSEKRNIIYKLAKEFNVIKKDYFNSDIDLIFGFSRNKFEESYSKQKSNYIDFAKMLPVFSEIIDSAIGIETHKRTKYKPDATLDNVFVLMSAYQEGEYIIPVKLEVKKFKDKNNSLHVAISLEKIKMTEISEQGDTENGVTQNSNSVNISIAQIFKKINIKDKDFLKYVPDGFLDARQKKVKKEALEEQSRQESLYSDRDTDGGFSQRSLLANALESTAESEQDKKTLAQYKKNIDMLSETQDRLHKVNAKIKELSFGKGKRDTEKLANLKRTAKELTDLINRYDKKLFSLESTDSLKRVLEVERKRAYAKATEESKNKLQAYKDKMIQREQNIRDKYQESRANAVEKRSKTEMKNKIKKLVGKLDSLLRNQTKEKHIPIYYQKSVAQMLEVLNLDEQLRVARAEKRMTAAEEKYTRLLEEEKAKENPDAELIEFYQQKLDKNTNTVGKVSEAIQSIKDAYHEITSSNDPIYVNNPEVENLLDGYRQYIGDTQLSDMTLKQLDYVYNSFKIVDHMISEANTGHKLNRSKTISDYAEEAVGEVRESHKTKTRTLSSVKIGKSEIKIPHMVSNFKWDYKKPWFAFRSLGSKVMNELYDNLRKGEDTWAVDTQNATKKFEELAEKYDIQKWSLDKKIKCGNVEITLDQLLSLYAYSKREAADKHLAEGGFVFDSSVKLRKGKKGIFEYQITMPEPQTVSKTDMIELMSNLTDDMKAWADEMQDYLSSDLSAIGNEVSRELYGINLFNEKHYFPIKAMQEVLDFNAEKHTDIVPNITNMGMTKPVLPNANNTIVLGGFTDIWARHCNDMAKYHAFALAMDDFTKVYNYGKGAQSFDKSVKVAIKNAKGLGDAANKYIQTFLQDVNGGVRADEMQGIDALISKFKKSSVMASASVIIQQPSAIGRAFGMINPKYFVKTDTNFNHAKTVAEMEKYAPIAIIKRLGGFDTNTGGKTSDIILGKDNEGLIKKANNALGYAPQKADELTWCAIWNACKREAKHKYNLEGEELLKKAGERFTEVIQVTQVYDSVFSRNAMMRSKSKFNKMVTAFMAEPITTMNDAVYAVQQIRQGNKKAGTSMLLGGFTSLVINSLLSSIVYAWRDDDEDETFAEKYISSAVGETVEGLKPITYLPVLKDIYSLAQGYDVERTDMALVSDVIDKVGNIITAYSNREDDMTDEELAEAQKEIEQAWIDAGFELLNLFGIPADNLRREIVGIAQTVTRDNDYETTWSTVMEAISEKIRDAKPFGRLTDDESKSDKIYQAIAEGDTEMLKRLKDSYKTEKAYESAVRQGLRDNDERIKAAAKAGYEGNERERVRICKEIIAEGLYSQDMVVKAVNAEINKLAKDEPEEEKEDTPEYESDVIYKASDINDAIEYGDIEGAYEIINELVEDKKNKYLFEAEQKGERLSERDAEKKAKSSLKSTLTSHWKDIYIEAYKSGDDEECKRIRQILGDSNLWDRKSEVSELCRNWLKESRKK